MASDAEHGPSRRAERSPSRRAEPDAVRRAVLLSAQALGTTHPNPPVGCVVLDRDGTVVGEGWTRPPG
ncbi:MAG: bifunctional diaminohydroxyphosphoribosylaminopyrimidine deaminase/5-amino-6-(5-phosphoribosylamino)uracil reductase, partial [Ramlibacter sp.]|nr:bifunctional diaminohydroxyphosphoribosylaminopyrimidine deaminase/5-amino-6-(5-phosphoribosylamino)uracil reductase [Cryobacterium sp.]